MRHQNAFVKLSALFPNIDQNWLKQCILSYRNSSSEEIITKIALKISELKQYPEKIGIELEQRNAALLTVLSQFPKAQPSFVRNLIFQGSSLHQIQVEMLKDDYPKQNGDEPLRERDLFRDENYIKMVKQRLMNEFPFHWESQINSFMAECNNYYPECFEKLEENKPSRIWNTFLPFTKRHSIKIRDFNFDLKREEENMERIKCAVDVGSDSNLAIEINKADYEAENQLITCGCCFGDEVFEDLVQCQYGHLFCRDCINTSLNVGLYDSGNIRGKELKCMSSTGDGCDALISMEEIKRITPPELYNNYQATIFQKLAHSSGLNVAFCPFCSIYGEVLNDSVWTDIIPIFFHYWYSNLEWFLNACYILASLSIAISSPNPFSSAYSSVFIYFVIKKVLKSKQNLIQIYINRIRLSRFIKLATPSVLNCKSCLKASCVECKEEWNGAHECFQKQKDSKRLFIESAMSQALIRTCPSCSIRFAKEDGCNLMKCSNCGYEMCYCCRQEVGKERYGHFCQHFRVIPGSSCKECDRCELYAKESDDVAVKKAVKQAELEWKALSK